MPRERRAGGGIDRLPSGRYRVRIVTPDGRRLSLGTHATKRAAEATYARSVTDQADGKPATPSAVTTPTLADYAPSWIDTRLTKRGDAPSRAQPRRATPRADAMRRPPRSIRRPPPRGGPRTAVQRRRPRPLRDRDHPPAAARSTRQPPRRPTQVRRRPAGPRLPGGTRARPTRPPRRLRTARRRRLRLHGPEGRSARAARLAGRLGEGPPPRSTSPRSTSTTSDTSLEPWQRAPAPAPRRSCTTSATPPTKPPSVTNTPPGSGTDRLRTPSTI